MIRLLKFFLKDIVNDVVGYRLPFLLTLIFAFFAEKFFPEHGYIYTIIFFFLSFIIINIILWKKDI